MDIQLTYLPSVLHATQLVNLPAWIQHVGRGWPSCMVQRSIQHVGSGWQLLEATHAALAWRSPRYAARRNQCRNQALIAAHAAIGPHSYRKLIMIGMLRSSSSMTRIVSYYERLVCRLQEIGKRPQRNDDFVRFLMKFLVI